MHSQLKTRFWFFVSISAICFFLIGNAQAKSNKQKVELVSDWQDVGLVALDSNVPIVLLVEVSDCRFCKSVLKEFLNPFANSERYSGKVIFSRISLDVGQMIINKDGHITETRNFCAKYEALFTPTIVFLDGNGNQLNENIVGFTGRDYFANYLEKGIENSIKTLQFKASALN